MAAGFLRKHPFRCWVLEAAWTTGARWLWRLSVGKVTYFHVRMRSQVPRRLPGAQPQVARAKVTYVKGHFQ